MVRLSTLFTFWRLLLLELLMIWGWLLYHEVVELQWMGPWPGFLIAAVSVSIGTFIAHACVIWPVVRLVLHWKGWGRGRVIGASLLAVCLLGTGGCALVLGGAAVGSAGYLWGSNMAESR